jgi:hypothetical protein
MKYVDWVLNEIDHDEKIRFPKRGGNEENGTCDGRVGSVMIREQSMARSFLERMGFLTSVMLYESFSISEIGIEIFTQLLEGQYSPIKRYEVVNTIPTWYAQIRNAL